MSFDIQSDANKYGLFYISSHDMHKYKLQYNRRISKLQIIFYGCHDCQVSLLSMDPHKKMEREKLFYWMIISQDHIQLVIIHFLAWAIGNVRKTINVI